MRISLGLSKIFYHRSMRQDSCNFILISTSSSWRGCDPEPPTVQLAARPMTEAVEGAKKLRVGGGGMPVPEKMQPFTWVRGMAGAVLDRQRRSLKQRGAARFEAARRPRAGWMAVRLELIASMGGASLYLGVQMYIHYYSGKATSLHNTCIFNNISPIIWVKFHQFSSLVHPLSTVWLC
jgi:hypothetical protein